MVQKISQRTSKTDTPEEDRDEFKDREVPTHTTGVPFYLPDRYNTITAQQQKAVIGFKKTIHPIKTK